MSNVVQFPRISNTDCQSATIRALTPEDLRMRAWSNYYRDERRRGVCSDLAHQRADAFLADLDRMNSRTEQS